MAPRPGFEPGSRAFCPIFMAETMDDRPAYWTGLYYRGVLILSWLIFKAFFRIMDYGILCIIKWVPMVMFFKYR